MSIPQDLVRNIGPFLKDRGFSRSGKHFTRIENDIAYCISLDAPGGLVYVTAYVMPLYIPCETRYYTYGTRLNNLKGAAFPVLSKDAAPHEKTQWCQNLCAHIERRILPFFQKISSPQKLVQHLERESAKTFFSCPDVFLERLKAYTYLYLLNFPDSRNALETYRSALCVCTFLTETAKQQHLEDIASIASILQAGKDSADCFCRETAEQNTRLFFRI